MSSHALDSLRDGHGGKMSEEIDAVLSSGKKLSGKAIVSVADRQMQWPLTRPKPAAQQGVEEPGEKDRAVSAYSDSSDERESDLDESMISSL